MWGAAPEPGDWVRARKTIPCTFTDSLLGGGVRPGTKGVVTRRSGSFIDVDFAIGYRKTSVSTPASNCSIDRRAGGLEQFRRRAHVIATIRVALALFILWPFISFVVQYLWQEHTLDGIEASFALAALDSGVVLVGSLIDDPVKTVLYLVFLAVAAKIAFPR